MACLLGSELLRAIRRGRRAGFCGIRLRHFRAAIAMEKIIYPGTGTGERPVWRRDVDFQFLQAAVRFRALVHRDPDAGLVVDFAAAEGGAATGAIAHAFGASLRADVLHLAENAIAAGLAAEERRLDGEFQALEAVSGGWAAVNPAKKRG